MRVEVARVCETDVLVVGAGAAASRAALAALDAGARVIIAVKRRVGQSGATNFPRKGSYGSAWQAVDGCGGADDSVELHYRDVMSAALGMADARMAWILAHEAPERLVELERWGFRLIADPEGKRPHYAGYSCFGTQPRAHGMVASPVGGHTGNMVATLATRIAGRGATIHELTAVVDLLVADGVCIGVLAIDAGGDMVAYRAGAVVLATGGAGQLFQITRIPSDVTGDGYAMALRAGAELVNMEFMQYMFTPVSGVPPAMSGPFWSLCPTVRDVSGRDILRDELPLGIAPEQVFLDRTLHYPFSARDASRWLDIAVERTIRAGRGTPRGGVLVDFSRVDVRTARRPRPQHAPPSPDIRIGDAIVEVAHGAHAVNGGIRVDEWGRTGVPGLFAAGETIGGPHGADRLGGAMLPACNVFGARAGATAADYARGVTRPPLLPDHLAPACDRLARFRHRSGMTAHEIRRALKALTTGTLVVLRTAEGLKRLLDEAQRLREELYERAAVGTPQALVGAIETENLLLVAEVMAGAALRRTESRGSHYREDHPMRDDDRWSVSQFWTLQDGVLRVARGRYRQDPGLRVQVDVADEPVGTGRASRR